MYFPLIQIIIQFEYFELRPVWTDISIQKCIWIISMNFLELRDFE